MSKHGPRYGTYDDYERPFEVDRPMDTSPLADPPEWKKDEIWGERWEEPVDDWEEQAPYASTSGLANDGSADNLL